MFDQNLILVSFGRPFVMCSFSPGCRFSSQHFNKVAHLSLPPPFLLPPFSVVQNGVVGVHDATRSKFELYSALTIADGAPLRSYLISPLFFLLTSLSFSNHVV